MINICGSQSAPCQARRSQWEAVMSALNWFPLSGHNHSRVECKLYCWEMSHLWAVFPPGATRDSTSILSA